MWVGEAACSFTQVALFGIEPPHPEAGAPAIGDQDRPCRCRRGRRPPAPATCEVCSLTQAPTLLKRAKRPLAPKSAMSSSLPLPSRSPDRDAGGGSVMQLQPRRCIVVAREQADAGEARRSPRPCRCRRGRRTAMAIGEELCDLQPGSGLFSRTDRRPLRAEIDQQVVRRSLPAGRGRAGRCP